MAIWVIAALAEIVITGPPPPGPPPSNPDYIFSSYDYPLEAVRNRWEGTVVVHILIDADGRQKSCTIIQSSGHQVLDETTCRLIMTRARYRAEKDEAGNAIESSHRPPPIRWRLRK